MGENSAEFLVQGNTDLWMIWVRDLGDILLRFNQFWSEFGGGGWGGMYRIGVEFRPNYSPAGNQLEGFWEYIREEMGVNSSEIRLCVYTDFRVIWVRDLGGISPNIGKFVVNLGVE